MAKASILLAIMGAGMASILLSTSAWPQTSPPERRVVLLGARWCAPCMAEWRNLPQLAARLAPDRIVLAWVDRPVSAPGALAGQVSIMPVEEARVLARRLGGQGYGLPMATIMGKHDEACPPWRRVLRPEDVSEFYRICLEGSSGERR